MVLLSMISPEARNLPARMSPATLAKRVSPSLMLGKSTVAGNLEQIGSMDTIGATAGFHGCCKGAMPL